MRAKMGTWELSPADCGWPETSMQGALVVADRLCEAIESMKDEVEGIPVTATMGVAETTGQVELTLEDLINRADAAIYTSKRAGRNQVTAWKNPHQLSS